MFRKVNSPQPVHRGGRFKRLNVLVVVTLLLAVLPVSLAPVSAVRIQPLLLDMAARQPDQVVSVIVQKTVKDDRVERAVKALGGTVTKDLHIINAFAADLKAKDAPQLAKVDGVRWVSLDAPTHSTGALAAVTTAAPRRAAPLPAEFQATGTLANVSNALGNNDSTSPDVAVDGRGVIHVVFRGKTGSKIDIFYANNASGTFGTPVNLSNQLGGNDSSYPAIAVDSSGIVHVIFQGLTGSKKDIFYVTNRAGSFSAPLNLTNQFGGNDAFTPVIAVDGRGVAHVAFQGLKDTVTKKKDVFYLNNQGGTFGTPVNVSNQLGKNDSLTPALAADGSGAAHVVFQGLTDTLTKKRDIFYTNNRSGAFSAPLKVTNQLGGSDASTPVVTVSGSGVAHVFLVGKRNALATAQDIFYAQNLSGTFSTPVRLSTQDDTHDSLTPQAAADSAGAVTVVFQGSGKKTVNGTTTYKKDVFYLTNHNGAFGEPADLSNLLNNNDSIAPAVAIDGNGRAHVVFQGKPGGKQDIVYTSLKPFNVTNSLGGHDATSPALAVDGNGAAHLVVQGQAGGKKDIFYLTNRTGSFGLPVNLSNSLGGNDSAMPDVAIDATGAVHAVFQGTTGGKMDIFYVNNLGGTFNPPINLSNGLGGNDALAARLAVDSAGAVYVVFQGKTGSTQDIFYVTNRNGSFSAPVNLSNGLGGKDAVTPLIAVDNAGTAHVVFQGQTGSKNDLFYLTNPSGTFAAAPANMTNGLGNNDSTAPDIAVDGNGAIHVVFQGKTGAVKDIFYVTDSTGVFGTPINLSNGQGGKDSSAPGLALDKSGVARVAFLGLSNPTATRTDVYYVTNLGGTFSAPVDLVGALPVNDAAAPVLGVGGGTAHLFFQRKSGSKYDLYQDQVSVSSDNPVDGIILMAGPYQVGDNQAIQVTMTLAAGQATPGVNPGMPDIVDLEGKGASAVCGYPTPATQDLAAGQVATFTWTCSSLAGALPDHIVFEANAGGTGVAWPTARSNSVFVLPVVEPVFVSWATILGASVQNSFTNPQNAVDAAGLGLDNIWNSGANVKGSFSGFQAQVTPGYVIGKVRLALHAYVDQASSKTIKFQVYLAGNKVGEVQTNGHLFDGVVGVNKADTVYVDLTNSRQWQWGDFYNGLEIAIDQGEFDRATVVHYDAIGLRVTGVPGTDPGNDGQSSSTLVQAPLNTGYLVNAFNGAVRATDVWNEAPAYLQGYGVAVAVVDSGVGNLRGLDKRKITDVNFNLTYHNGSDLYGHGTIVAGVVGGDGMDSAGQYMGIAPKANVLNVRVSDDQGLSTESEVINALQWIYDHKDAYNIRVVNLSLNSNIAQSYHTSPLDAAVEVLWFNRIVVVVSAGNNGLTNAGVVYPPANDPFVITVGAADDHGTIALADDTVATFSAYGTTLDGFAKPDLVAPGRNIVAALPENDKLGIGIAHATNRVGKDYFRMSGTSVSAPIVSGAVALLLQDEPTLNPDQVKYRLMATANQTWPGYAPTQAGAGYLDIFAAIHGTTTATANTGVAVSNLLTTGPDGVLGSTVQWSSVQWSSVQWSSVQWSSVQWSSVQWSSVQWSSDFWEP